jgi:hypothetical protein
VKFVSVQLVPVSLQQRFSSLARAIRAARGKFHFRKLQERRQLALAAKNGKNGESG